VVRAVRVLSALIRLIRECPQQTTHHLSNPKRTSLRSFVAFAALRFKFISLASTVIDRRYRASRAVGDKWAGHGGPAYRFSANKLRVLRASAFRLNRMTSLRS